MITGASTGIGAACALHLDGLGFRVFAGVRRASDGDALRRRGSARLTPLLLDVTDAGSIAAAADAASETVGPTGLAGLVNNAGIVVAGPLEILPVEDLRRQFEVNVIGLLAVTQALLPLIRRGHGRIVNLGSISGRMASPLVGPYGASKFAVSALTDVMRLEVQPWGIDVSLVEPGAVATPIWEKSRAASDRLKQIVEPAARALYSEAVAAIEAAATRSANEAIPTDTVVRAVTHALTARRPKTRYLVGTRARIQSVIARLPDRLRDRLLTKAIGIPPRNSKT